LKWNNIWSEYILFENLLSLLLFGTFLIPILLILLIKKRIIKYTLLGIFLLLLALAWFPIMFSGIFLINDLSTGNGYRKVFEYKLTNNEYFSIYRTPDKGAFGGDYKMYSIDKKLGLGFISRNKLGPDEYKLLQNVHENTEVLIYKQDSIFIDNKLLQGKGDIK